MFKFLIVVAVVSVKDVYTLDIIGSVCISESTNSPGLCKLLTQCKQIRDELALTHKLPQTCGFEGTQPIVCCPKPRQPECREYASNTRQKQECGHKIVKRITDGKLAGRTEFPHMALLAYHTQDSEQPKWLCGGSLISEQYILTGGNCLLSKKYGEPKFVVLGVTNLNDTSHRQEIKVANRVAHPEYNKGNPYNDIGLLKLEKPVEVNSFVRPACLYTNFDIPVTETIATGWGSTVYFRDNTNEDLLKVTEDIVDYQSCNDSYKTLRGIGKGIINDMHICTGGGSREKGTCRGDAGGPIQIYHNNDPTLCMYDIVGVISFGIRCDGPSVNTRLFYYIKWIEDVVWPENI